MGKWEDYKISGEHVKDIHRRLTKAVSNLPYKTNIAEITIAFSILIRASKVEKET